MTFVAANRRTGQSLALLCLAAVLALSGIQALHVHRQQQSGKAEALCTLCVVSHTLLRPQQDCLFVAPVGLPAPRVMARVSLHSQTSIFRWFVRPPPAA